MLWRLLFPRLRNHTPNRMHSGCLLVRDTAAALSHRPPLRSCRPSTNPVLLLARAVAWGKRDVERCLGADLTHASLSLPAVRMHASPVGAVRVAALFWSKDASA